MGLTLSVIVPSYGRPADLARCLEALAAQIRPADEVCGVAQRLDAETLGVLHNAGAKVPNLKIVIVEVPGVVAALNRGVEKSFLPCRRRFKTGFLAGAKPDRCLQGKMG